MVVDGALLDLALHGDATGMRHQPDPRAYLARFGYDAPELDAVADVRPLDVEVNHGIWLWRCPCYQRGADGTVGGGVAFADTPVGWCPHCENVGCGGLWRPLRFPIEREAIEAELARRVDPQTRNWWPGETVDELARERRENEGG